MENRQVYNLDNHTQLQFLHSKTVIVVDKNQFLVCKQLLKQNATDNDFASLLSIPVEKVPFFKYKMRLFENQLKVRRRASKLGHNINQNIFKKVTSAQNRFKKARDLIAKQYSTSEISKILNVSERSVTRFKKRIREEKQKLKAEGKLNIDPEDDDNSFKYLTEKEKFIRAKHLFERGLKFCEIALMCKVSERTVRRWKDRLTKFKKDTGTNEANKVIALINQKNDDDANILNIFEEPQSKSQQRQRRPFYNREIIEYATELIQNGLSNKEMSTLLELSIANVRKLKFNIGNGTINELIDDSIEYYSKYQDNKDPLNDIDGTTIPISYGSRRKSKINLTERDMHIVRLLKERGVRTMEIAKMLNISERSVTRLINKSKEFKIHQYGSDVVDEVEKLMGKRTENDLDNEVEIEEMVDEKNQFDEEFSQNFISKKRIGFNLIRMNVKLTEIAKILEVTEKQVLLWKKQINCMINTIEQDPTDTCVIKDSYAKHDDMMEEHLETN